MVPAIPSLQLTPFWRKKPLLLVRATDAVRLCRDRSHEMLPRPQSLPYLFGSGRDRPGEARDFVAKAHLLSRSLADCDDAFLLDLLRRLVGDGQLVVVRESDETSTNEPSALLKQRKVLRDLDRARRSTLKLEGSTYRLVADADLAKVPGREDYSVVSHAEAVRVLDGLIKLASPAEVNQLREARDQLSRDWRPPFPPDGLVLLKRIVVPQAATKPDAPTGKPHQSSPSKAVEDSHADAPASRPCAALTEENQAKALIQASHDGTPFCEECDQPSSRDTAHIAVHVETSSGEPVSGVTIEVSGGGSGGVTNASGDLDIGDVKSDTYTVSGTKDNYTPSPAEQTLSADAGASTPCNLVMDVDQAKLAVHVQDSRGSPVAGAAITLNDAQSMGNTDGDGNLDLGLFPSGSYTVEAQKDDYVGTTPSQQLDAAAGMDTQFTLVLDAAEQAGQMAVHVQTSSGVPVPGVAITVSGDVTGGTTDDNGDLEIGEVAPGSYTVSGIKDGFAPNPAEQTLAVDAGSSTSFGLTMECDQAHLLVHVQDADGNPVEGAAISVNDAQSIGNTDSEGNLDLGLFVPGTITILAQHEDYAGVEQQLDAAASADTLFRLQLG